MLGSGRLPPRTIPFRRQVIARRCIPLRVGASRSEDFRLDGLGEALHHAGLGQLAICAATDGRPLGLVYRSWTRIYAAALCRARNAAARARPQRRQRQRPFAWSTFRLSGVSKWPLSQIPGMTMGSRIRSREKHTTSVLVAPKHAPATNFNGLHRCASDCLSSANIPPRADRLPLASVELCGHPRERVFIVQTTQHGLTAHRDALGQTMS